MWGCVTPFCLRSLCWFDSGWTVCIYTWVWAAALCVRGWPRVLRKQREVMVILCLLLCWPYFYSVGWLSSSLPHIGLWMWNASRTCLLLASGLFSLAEEGCRSAGRGLFHTTLYVLSLGSLAYGKGKITDRRKLPQLWGVLEGVADSCKKTFFPGTWTSVILSNLWKTAARGCVSTSNKQISLNKNNPKDLKSSIELKPIAKY